MIPYTGQLKNAQFNIEKKRKGRSKKTVKRCLDIFTLDTEVTSAWITDKGEVIGYTPGKGADYWNELNKVSLPYIWMFSFNDTVYYGREIKDFIQVLKDLPRDTKIIIWVHNLGYEFQTSLINILKVKSLFARTPHSPMYVYFEEFPDIQFRCSYILTNMSLATWGKQLNIEKLTGDLDYTKLRTPLSKLSDKELGYCERDCIVLYRGILDHLKTYKDVFDIPTTSTGKVRRPFKQLVTSDKEYMKTMKALVPSSIEEYERWRHIFAGGYTHCNRKYLGKVVDDLIYHVDIASSYPFILCAYKFPYGPWAYLGRVKIDMSKAEDRAYIMKVRLKNVVCKTWNTYISSSKVLDSKKLLKDNGRVLAAEEIVLYVTEFDWDIILKTYQPKEEDIEPLGCWCCHKQYLPAIYINFVLNQYEAKSSLKGYPDGSPEAERYKIAKQYINALYGMAVSNIVMADCEWSENGWTIGELTREKVEYKFNKMRRWFDKSYFLHYAAGCWVTSAARHRLWSCILHKDQYGNMDNDLIYTDTDSLFYLNRHDWTWFNNDAAARLWKSCRARDIDFNRTRPKDKDGKEHPLGVLEYEPNADRFKSLGAKKYIEERDGKLYMTVSGVNKKAVNCLSGIEDFAPGFEFDKDSPHVHKSEITYLDDMPRVVWPDGYVSDLKHGINMRPTGYSLSMPTVYDGLIKTLEALINPSDQMYIKQRGVIHE